MPFTTRLNRLLSVHPDKGASYVYLVDSTTTHASRRRHDVAVCLLLPNCNNRKITRKLPTCHIGGDLNRAAEVRSGLAAQQERQLVRDGRVLNSADVDRHRCSLYTRHKTDYLNLHGHLPINSCACAAVHRLRNQRSTKNAQPAISGALYRSTTL